MAPQNFENHRQFKPKTLSHQLYYFCVVSFNLLAIVSLYQSIKLNQGRFYATLFFLAGIALLTAYFMFRSFSLKAQDRAIRAEENLRYYVLTGKLLDKNLRMHQIVALRFASDQEFLTLVDRALSENLSNRDIKEAIKDWKEDNHRA